MASMIACLETDLTWSSEEAGSSKLLPPAAIYAVRTSRDEVI